MAHASFGNVAQCETVAEDTVCKPVRRSQFSIIFLAVSTVKSSSLARGN